ncbi:hypothetical protein QBC34DRAFT_300198 [Podospora aff. communis PSN243]|uniref:AAA+ ATPase domain-containing protein n=1 Tax=Podospora aff. communis PSN243 TaxID=3040156 RepID=A0AAV9GK43_9PEZI|nr:hypothetical protein QBC34DRAFT_300198 [Podospora aff. communis PSN243]
MENDNVSPGDTSHAGHDIAAVIAPRSPFVSSPKEDSSKHSSTKGRPSEHGNPSLPDEIEDDEPLQHDETVLTEIEALRRRLLELEQSVKPKLSTEALMARWDRTREMNGSRRERELWRQEEKRRKAALMRDNTAYVEGRKWWNKVEDETSRNISHDVKYNKRLLKLRKEWVRTRAFHDHATRTMGHAGHTGGLGDGSQDSDSDNLDSLSDYSDATEEHAVRRQLLQKNWEFERQALELEYRMKVAKRARKLERERARRREEAKPTEPALPPPRMEFPASREFSAARPTPSFVPDVLPIVRRVEWGLFLTGFPSLPGRTPSTGDPVLDVLVGDPVIHFDLPSKHRTGSDGFLDFSARLESGPSNPKGIGKPAENRPATEANAGVISTAPPLPERIRLYSRYIHGFLSTIGGIEAFPITSVVLLRPFRVLVHYSVPIRSRIAQMEHTLAQMQVSAASESKEASGSSPSMEQEGVPPAANLGLDPDIPTKPLALDPGRIVSTTQLAHLRCLLNFMDTDIAGRINYLNSPSCEKVVFSDLWHLFHPGGHVIRNDGKQAYRILRVNSVPHRAVDPISRWLDKSLAKEEETPLCVECVHLDFDGKQLGPISTMFRIQRFERERLITSLEIYPLRFHPLAKPASGTPSLETDSLLWEQLVNRGRKFLRVSAVHLGAIRPMYYAGPTSITKDEIESPVVVDFEAAFAIDRIKNGWKPDLETLIGSGSDEAADTKMCEADCCISDTIYDDSYVEALRNKEFMGSLLPKSREDMPSVLVVPRPINNKNTEDGLTEDDLAIMSHRVFGFVLRSPQLDLTYLTDIQPSLFQYSNTGDDDNETDQTSFDRLVLPDGHKDMILSLVTQHFRDKESAKNETDLDIVRGKGKGLILLLHGAPGVGKTTTAEGVAEKFNKPLFQLTCGDLGTTAREVEDALETNFSLASRWGCILLLDEADVFLAQRSKEDFQRNGLVAVFLRVLEYYSGILFLTTNRVGDFDEAFASRIHISLFYPELDKDKTLEVFKLNLQVIRNRFSGKPRKFTPDEMGIGAFAEKYWKENPFDHWNGRQIRNACQTALALAEYEAQGKDYKDVLKPNAEIKLEVSHFETVSRAYLEFSSYIRDIYGTHAARRAKEAGLRAMWVNEKGEIVASVGPKEAGVLKGDRKARFMQRAQGRYYEAASQERFQQHREVYRGQRGGFGRGGATHGPPHTRTRPTETPSQAPGEYYQEGSHWQRQQRPMAHPQEQGWDDPQAGYEEDFDPQAGGPAQFQQYRGGRPGPSHLRVPPVGGRQQSRQYLDPHESHSSHYEVPDPEDDGSQYPGS